jgi:hypothetical protein
MPLGLYLIKLNVGNEGEPGAPILHIQAAVDAPTGHITGQAEITQAIAPPDGELAVKNLSGQIRSLGLGPAKRVVTLTGDVVYYLPPPEIGAVTYPFSASLVVGESDWDGRGSFSYGPHHVEDVPVTPVQD